MVTTAPAPPVDDRSVEDRRARIASQIGVALLSAAVVLVAARREPILSPDSVTYLSAAESLRGFDGYVDFTGEPLAHFPPVYPLLLTIGGRSLMWAAVVGAACTAASGALLTGILWKRVRPAVAVGASIVFVVSPAVVRHGASVWSEMPYVMLSLGAMALLARERDDGTRRIVVAGLIAALALLTRYAGAGLVVTGLVMVVAASFRMGAATVRRRTLAFLAGPVLLGAAWMVRNLIATGEPLGPHFEGGAGESVVHVLDRQARAVGRLVIDTDLDDSFARPIGVVALVGLLVAVLMVGRRRRVRVIDLGMATYGLTSVLLPLASRLLTGTDVSFRIMAPVLVAVVFFAAVTIDRVADRPLFAAAALATAVVVGALGARETIGFSARTDRSLANSRLYSPALDGLVAALPADATVLTNSPHRVWWQTGRVPTLFAFIEPRPGNSHFPLAAEEIVDRTCPGATYLAWYPVLTNAQGADPGDVRPDLTESVDLRVVESVPGGTLYRLDVDPASC